MLVYLRVSFSEAHRSFMDYVLAILFVFLHFIFNDPNLSLKRLSLLLKPFVPLTRDLCEFLDPVFLLPLQLVHPLLIILPE